MTALTCEHCGGVLTRSAGGRVKLLVKSRIVAFDDDGRGEMVCPHCRQDTRVPVRLDMAGSTRPEPPPDSRPERIGRVLIVPGVYRRRPVTP